MAAKISFVNAIDCEHPGREFENASEQQFGEVPGKAVVLSERLTREEVYDLYRAFNAHKSKLTAGHARREKLRRCRARRGLPYLSRHPLLFRPKLGKAVTSFLRTLLGRRLTRAEPR